MNTLDIYFKKEETNNAYDYFYVLSKKIKIVNNKYSIPIPEFIFKDTTGCAAVNFILIDSRHKNKRKRFIINLYPCLNVIYVYLNDLGLISLELIFLNKDEDILIDNEKLIYDTNNNNFRKRIVLVGKRLGFKLGKKNFEPHRYLSGVNIDNNNSFQLSFYSKTLIVAKPIKIYKKKINFQYFYEKFIERIAEFDSDFKAIFDEHNQNTEKEIPELINKNKNIIEQFNKLNFTKSLSVLKNEFNNNEYIDFIYKILINKIIKYHWKDRNDNKKIVESIKSLDILKNKIMNDINLEIYQKIFGVIEIFFIYNRYYNIDKNVLNTIKYIQTKNIAKDSVIGIAIDFIINYINELNEESPVFFKILEINSNFGYAHDKKVYTFNLLSVDDVKKHLKEIIPKEIFFYKVNSNISASNYSQTGILSINEFKLYENLKEIPLDTPINQSEIENGHSLAMRIARIFLHEIIGQKKFRDKAPNKIKSPLKIVSNNKIKTLTYALSTEKPEDDYIKILLSKKKDKGDSGHVLDIPYGFAYHRIPTMYCISLLKNSGKLISHPELFVHKDKIEILKEYVKEKYYCEKNNIEIKNWWSLTIEDEINEMEKIIIKEKEKKLTNLLGKKRKLSEEEEINTSSNINKKNYKINKNDSIIESSCQSLNESLLQSNFESNSEIEKNDEIKEKEEDSKNVDDDDDLFKFPEPNYSDEGDDEFNI